MRGRSNKQKGKFDLSELELVGGSHKETGCTTVSRVSPLSQGIIKSRWSVSPLRVLSAAEQRLTFLPRVL